MEIQALKLFVTEADMNEQTSRNIPKGTPIENLRLQLKPEGVLVTGEYRALLMRISFETLWKLQIVSGEIEASLETVEVAGYAASTLKGMLFKQLQGALANRPGVRVQDETVRVNLEEAAGREGVNLKANLTAVHCGLGTLVLEAGTTG